MVEELNDLEKILKTNQHFLLGPWVADAESWAIAERVRRDFHEQN